MSQYNRQSVLASFGNLTVAAAGRTVFPVNASAPNARAGEILIIEDGVTIAAGDIATAKEVKVAFGIGPVGGNATGLRYLAGEDINLCDSKIYATVSEPVCGSPQVVDVFVNGCLNANDAYSIAINLDDAYVRSNYQTNEKAQYVYTVTTDVCACSDCDPTYSHASLVCKFVDQINGKHTDDPTKISRFIKADLTKQYQPFRAARLYMETTLGSADTTRVFCLTVGDGACIKCSELTGINGISIDGEVTNFVGTSLPGDTTVTTHAHIKQLVSEINRALEPIGGSAYIKHGIGNCCDYQLEINSCADVIELVTDGEVNLVECDAYNPFATFDIEPICIDCASSPESIAPQEGFRIYLDPVEVPCDCTYPPNMPAPNIYGRTVDVQAVGNWSCNSLLVKESSAQVLPENFGYFWQDFAHYGNHRGGSARDFRYNNIHRGRIGLPDADSRALNSAKGVFCDEQYCVYNVQTTTTKNRLFNNALVNVNTDIDYVLVPESDNVTIAAWETILAALQARGVCVAGNITCGGVQ